jgi:hypothetical protein
MLTFVHCKFTYSFTKVKKKIALLCVSYFIKYVYCSLIYLTFITGHCSTVTRASADCKEIRIAVNMSYVVGAVCIFIDFKSDHYIFQFFILANGFDSC